MDLRKMGDNRYLDDLKSLLSLFTDEDLVWALHVYHKNEVGFNPSIRRADMDFSCLQMDIEFLNGLSNSNSLKDISKYIIQTCEQWNRRDIEEFIIELKDFKAKIRRPNTDFSKVKNNERLLNFTCTIMLEEVRESILSDFKIKYFQFLYIFFTYEFFYDNPREIEKIIASFSDVYSKFPLHFKNNTDTDFYLWAKNYMNDNRVQGSRAYIPTEHSEYPIIVNSILDMLYHKNPDSHYALRKKLANAWYQKKHRQENKGKKPNYYALTVHAKNCLGKLCYKYNLDEDKMIEHLINKSYVEECVDHNGDEKY